MSEAKAPPTKKFRRKLTPFLCREMLYDYATDSLDRDRRQAVEEFLATDKECQTILDEIRKGLDFAAALANIDVKPAVLSELKEAENALSLGKRYVSWKEWPDSLRWSLTAVCASIVLAGMVALIPWKSLSGLRTMLGAGDKGRQPEVIEVAKLTRPVDESQLEALQDQQEGEVADEGSGDEEIDASGDEASGATQAAAVATPPASVAKTDVTLIPPGPTPNLLQASPGQLIPTQATGKPESKSVASKDPDQTPATQASRESKPKGYVNRAFMTLDNLDELGPKIVDHVIELGGEKAGEVELGWKRGTGRYYHFAMPEENQDKLLEKLRAYGPVRLSKDPHPRVMPQGQVRFILWIEAGDSQ